MRSMLTKGRLFFSSTVKSTAVSVAKRGASYGGRKDFPVCRSRKKKGTPYGCSQKELQEQQDDRRDQGYNTDNFKFSNVLIHKALEQRYIVQDDRATVHEFADGDPGNAPDDKHKYYKLDKYEHNTVPPLFVFQIS